jgi:hypothetical protein
MAGPGMFGSAILDVAAGVVMAFLGVSLAASALTEALNSFMNLRQTTLIKGVQDLLNDPGFSGLAKDLFNHALINPLANGAATTVKDLTGKPAYIDAQHFASALVEVVQQRAPGQPFSVAVGRIENPQIRQVMQGFLVRAAGDEAQLQLAIGNWIDASMERVSGVYKRHTQFIAFLFALGVAVCLNVDALHISNALWQRPALLGALPAPAQPGTGATSGATAKAAQGVLNALDQASLIGWENFDQSERNPWGCNATLGGVLGMLLGWVMVAGASLFGAPFWFDALQNITQLRGVGGGAGVQQRKPDAVGS